MTESWRFDWNAVFGRVDLSGAMGFVEVHEE